mgnify:CR=1 FL=1
MSIDAKQVKTLRDKTGAGMMDCKKALVETNGDVEKAVDYLRKSGVAKAEKKGTRATKEGMVYSYIHAGGRLGVLVELNCETDFVAKTEGFNELAHNVAMQIAATNPISLSKDNVPEDIVERERNIYSDQAKASMEKVAAKAEQKSMDKAEKMMDKDAKMMAKDKKMEGYAKAEAAKMKKKVDN